MEKETMNLKECKEGNIGELGRRKEKEKMMYLYYLKSRRNIF